MKVLMTCFDISPYQGSEASVGWNYAYGMSKIHEVHVIAEDSKRADLLEWMNGNPECSLKIFYVKAYFNWTIVKYCPPTLYYYINQWERHVAELAKQLDEKYNYDILHKVTLTGFRSTGFLDRIGKPVIWGPIGGFQISPWCLLPSLGLKAFFFYGFRNILNLYDMKWRNKIKKFASSVQIIAATQDTQRFVKKYWKQDSVLIPEVGCVDSVSSCKIPNEDRGGVIVNNHKTIKIGWSSMFYPRKALNLLLEAVAMCCNKERIIIEVIGGSNQNDYYEKRWKKLGEELKLNIVWHGKVQRSKCLEIMQSFDFFSITSVADMTSTVLLEALSNGLPVIVPNKFGFANVINEECGIKVEVHSYKQFVRDYAKAIDFLIEDKEALIRMKKGAYKRSADFAWDKKILQLDEVYRNVISHYSK